MPQTGRQSVATSSSLSGIRGRPAHGRPYARSRLRVRSPSATPEHDTEQRPVIKRKHRLKRRHFPGWPGGGRGVLARRRRHRHRCFIVVADFTVVVVAPGFQRRALNSEILASRIRFYIFPNGDLAMATSAAARAVLHHNHQSGTHHHVKSDGGLAAQGTSSSWLHAGPRVEPNGCLAAQGVLSPLPHALFTSWATANSAQCGVG